MKRDLIAICAAARLLPESSREAYLQEYYADEAERERVRLLLLEAAEADHFFGDPSATTIAMPLREKGAGYAEKEGDEIGSYTLRQRLGEGGFGTVWMAEQKEPISRMVALKVIKAGMDTKEVLARFEAERQALAMMDHTHIAKALDADRAPVVRDGAGQGHPDHTVQR